MGVKRRVTVRSDDMVGVRAGIRSAGVRATVWVKRRARA